LTPTDSFYTTAKLLRSYYFMALLSCVCRRQNDVHWRILMNFEHNDQLALNNGWFWFGYYNPICFKIKEALRYKNWHLLFFICFCCFFLNEFLRKTPFRKWIALLCIYYRFWYKGTQKGNTSKFSIFFHGL
jgi:hypothetical protein